MHACMLIAPGVLRCLSVQIFFLFFIFYFCLCPLAGFFLGFIFIFGYVKLVSVRRRPDGLIVDIRFRLGLRGGSKRTCPRNKLANSGRSV